MSKDKKDEDDLSITSAKFEFALNAAFKDPEFVESIKKKWDELLADGRKIEHAHHALSMWTISEIRERIKNEP